MSERHNRDGLETMRRMAPILPPPGDEALASVIDEALLLMDERDEATGAAALNGCALKNALRERNEANASRDRMRETLRQVLAAWDAETAEMCDGAPEPERNVYDVLSEREPWLWGENDDG